MAAGRRRTRKTSMGPGHRSRKQQERIRQQKSTLAKQRGNSAEIFAKKHSELIQARINSEHAFAKRVVELEKLFTGSVLRRVHEEPEKPLSLIMSDALSAISRSSKIHGFTEQHLVALIRANREKMPYLTKLAEKQRKRELQRRATFDGNMQKFGIADIHTQRAAREAYGEITKWLREGKPMEKDVVGSLARISQVKYGLPIEVAQKISDLFLMEVHGGHALRPEYEELRVGKAEPVELIPKKKPKR